MINNNTSKIFNHSPLTSNKNQNDIEIDPSDNIRWKVKDILWPDALKLRSSSKKTVRSSATILIAILQNKIKESKGYIIKFVFILIFEMKVIFVQRYNN